MSGYVKTFKVKDGDKNKKLMFLCASDKKLLEKHKTIWTKIEALKNIELIYDDGYIKTEPVYDDGYIKTKIRTKEQI